MLCPMRRRRLTPLVPWGVAGLVGVIAQGLAGGNHDEKLIVLIAVGVLILAGWIAWRIFFRVR